MAIPVIATTNGGETDTTNPITLTKPSGVSTGDFLLIIVGNDDNTDTVQYDDSSNKPTGFTLINESGSAASDVHTAAFWRIATGSEGATIDVPADSGTAANDYWGYYMRITGAHGSDPIDIVGADVVQTSADSVDITAVTTTVADCLAFAVASFDGGEEGTPPQFATSGTGWSEYDYVPTGTGDANMTGLIATKDMASAGGTLACTFTSDPGYDDGWTGFQFAIAPVAAGGGSMPLFMRHMATLRNE